MEIARDVKTFKIEELSAKQGVWDNDKKYYSSATAVS